MENFKACSKCGERKPATSEYFVRKKDCKDGISGTCKSCKSKRDKEYQERNKESIKKQKQRYILKNKDKKAEADRKYYLENKKSILEYRRQHYLRNKEKRNNQSRMYYIKNKEKIDAWQIKYHEDNKEKISKYRRQYGIINRETYNMHGHNRRARERKLVATLTQKQWEQIKSLFGNRCAYCGKKKFLTKDHFISLTNNGEFSHNNIIPACLNCNCSKKDRSFFSWYPTFKHYSKQREQNILKYLGYTNGIQQLSLI
ncbi:MAG: HNH endonuclease [Bacillota bacterium]|nr:HNH endonuclease [Bacillota bacterium]